MKHTKHPDHGAWGWWFAFLAVLALVSGCGGGDLKFPTEYQAVLLDTGQVFFGKVADAGSPYLLLQDVYYVQRLVEADKKEPRNVLVKRGSELHGPEFMRINSRHVVLIEPVSADSRVAHLIREAKLAGAAAPPAAAPPAAAPPAAAPPAVAPPVAAPPAAAPPVAAPREEKRAPARR